LVNQTEKAAQLYREAGIELIAIKQDDCCETCNAGAVVVPIDAVPKIPRPECTRRLGCCCAIRPATKDEREAYSNTPAS
jgi:hypothetical protein